MSSVVSEPRAAPAEIAAAPTPSRRYGGRAGGAVALLWLLSGVYFVGADQQAVVTRFGAVVEPRILPGLHYALPWPVDRVTRLKVNETKRLVIGAAPADLVLGTGQPLASQFLTGDQNIIQMRVVAQYSVSVPADYLFRSMDVARVTGAVVESELARRVARTPVDAILTTQKLAVQEAVRAAAQRRLDELGAGVKVSTVNIDNVTAPPEAAEAFRDVASARADAARIVNEAQSYANDLLPRARGEARQALESAEAYRASLVDRASGEAARFAAVAAEYAKAPEVTATRFYIEALEQILPKIRKLIVDPNGNLDLSIIRKGEAPKP